MMMSDIQTLKNELQSIKSEQARLRRRLSDSLFNLDEENLPELWRKIRKHQSGTDDSLSTLELSADAQGAQLSAIAEQVGDADDAIAALEIRADTQGAQISLVAQEGTIKAAAIVAAINGQSTASISASRINFTGFTTFVRPDDLGSNGTTTIDGGRITVGTLSTDKLTKNTHFAIAFESDIWTKYGILFSDGIDIVGSLHAGGSSSIEVNSLGGFYANDGFVISDTYINGYIDARLNYWGLI